MNSHIEEEHLENRGLDLKLWGRFLQHLKPHRRSVYLLCGGGAALAIVEPLMPLTVGRIIDAAASGQHDQLPARIAEYVGLIVTFSILVFTFIWAAGNIATGIAYNIRQHGFEHLQRLSFSFYDKKAVGWLMARMTSDIGRIAGLAPWLLLDLTWGFLYLGTLSAVMLWLEWKLALLVMLVVPLLTVVSIIFQKRLLGHQREIRKTNSEITASYNEGIMGVETTQSLVREKQALGEFQVLTTRMYQASSRNMITAALYLPVVLSIGSLGVGLALWRGGITVGSSLSLGELIAFMQFAAHFSQPIQELAARFTDLQAAQASAERLQSMLDEEPEIKDPEVADPERCVADGVAVRNIEFAGVDFHYKPEEPILENFNLEIAEGESIALVGATGSGKTTIAGLLCRFYEPTKGVVSVDGINLSTRSQLWLQSRLGIVLQQPHLFSGTILENIRYGKLTASDEEVKAAAHRVGAHQFIASFESGYDTEVGEEGCLLSSGERQFVSLARAVLADPAIFVMDEATSSLDTETERQIQEGIDRILEGRISVIIAHRLATIRRVDRILVIDKGKIIEEGSHLELMARKGAYHSLYLSQFAREQGAALIEESGRESA